MLEPHFPVSQGGRPPKTHLRDVVDAILYLLRTGCQWRYLPKEFPPKSTVWRYFDTWQRDGTWDTIHDLLRRKVRTQEKPYAPRPLSIDSQSIDTTSGGEERGRDNAKNVDGRKRHILVDRLGLLLAVLVTAANVDDAQTAQTLLTQLEGQPVSRVKTINADSKYHNFAFEDWVKLKTPWEINVINRPKGAKGWVLLPIRWTVERTFTWYPKCRRLSEDRDRTVYSSETFVLLAMIQHMLNPNNRKAQYY